MPADVKFLPIPGDSSHVRKRTVMAGAGERDQWSKVFPLHLPARYRIRYRWVDEMTLEQWVEPVPAEALQYSVNIGPTPNCPTNQASVEFTANLARETRRTELEAMKGPDLETLAAERGVAVTKDMKKQKSLLVAAVIEAEADDASRRAYNAANKDGKLGPVAPPRVPGPKPVA